MKKKIFIVMCSMLLIGVNVFAAGDLQVNGALGIGTAPSTSYKADTSAVNKRGVKIIASQNQDGVVGGDTVQGMNLQAETTGTATGNANGISLISKVSSTASSIGQAVGGNFTTALASPSAGTSNVDLTVAGKFVTFLNAGVRNYNVTQGYGFDLLLADNTFNGVGSLHYNDFKNININNAGNAYGALSVGSLSGIWINKQTLGSTKNYGIVLNGDGAGADIVLGSSQNTSIYANAGEIFVKDSGGFATQISPHDPVTGEWRFYSKNVKTGRVVEVNMEKLVKAVERLTGEKFLIETVEGIN